MNNETRSLGNWTDFSRYLSFARESCNQYEMQLTCLNSFVRLVVLFLEIIPKTI